MLYCVMSMEWSGGTDYNSTPIMATFTAGTTSTTVNVPLINDSIAEGPETFSLTITIPSSLSGQVELGTITEAVGYIIDDTSEMMCSWVSYKFTLLCC